MSLDVALGHHERGFALLPLRARGKEPNFRVLQEVHGSIEWKPLGSRRASTAEVRAWHDADPQTNVGVILGEASGGLIVADFDHKPKGVIHPPTPIAQTGAVARLSDLRFTTTPAVESDEYISTGDQGTKYKLPEYPSEGPFDELAKYEEPVRLA